MSSSRVDQHEFYIRFGERTDGPYTGAQLRSALEQLPPGVEAWVGDRWVDLVMALDMDNPSRVVNRVGDVVNGHVYTNEGWVPVRYLTPSESAPTRTEPKMDRLEPPQAQSEARPATRPSRMEARVNRRALAALGLTLVVLVAAGVWAMQPDVVAGEPVGPAASSQFAPLSSTDAEPEAILAAWTEAACGTTPVKRWPLGETGETLIRASCTYPGIGTLSERTAHLDVFASPEAVLTKLAASPCGTYRHITGPTWYSSTRIADVATALQKAGGTLVC